MVKKSTLVTFAVAAAAVYLLARREANAGPRALASVASDIPMPQQAQLWGATPAIYPGTSTAYAPKQTGQAATLPFGFFNPAPLGV
jgi:hypothetical protein